MFWVKNFHTLPCKWLSSKPKKSWSIFSDCILSLFCTSGHAFRHSRRNKDNPSRKKMASKRNSRNGKNASSLYFRLLRATGFSLGKPLNTETYSNNNFVFKIASFFLKLKLTGCRVQDWFSFSHTDEIFMLFSYLVFHLRYFYLPSGE